ncbi:MAG: hypothetical protein JF593_09940 [Novosphingobium sp.]|nr:hypothetical protein [Novosphingobium sp.]
MNKIVPIALAATLATFSLLPAAVHAEEASQSVRAVTDAAAPAAVAVAVGKMLYGANGQRIAAVYRVTATGAAQVILDGKLVTVPASTLSESNGKVTTSLTKSELLHGK